MVNVMATFGQLERRVIGQRTRDALAAKRAVGVRLGLPLTLPTVVVERIVSRHRDGRSWSAIACGPESDGGAYCAGWCPAVPGHCAEGCARQDAAKLST
jgi:DNA invertase Pin-like site-specific DNA recombinase